MYAFGRSDELNSDKYDEIINLYLENQYSYNYISRISHVHIEIVREIIQKYEDENQESSSKLWDLKRMERRLHTTFHRQLESLIGKCMNELDRTYVDEQIKINDDNIIPNETCEHMQRRLMQLFRKIIMYFTCDDKIEKQLRKIFENEFEQDGYEKELLRDLEEVERKLHVSFHYQLESLINKRLNDLDKMYVNEQMKINDSKIVPNETHEQMQERLMCLFREIIGHFMPYYGEKIEKQLREMFEEK